MTLKEVSDRFHSLTIYDTRHITDSYVEIVLLNKHTLELDTLLYELLGPPAKETAGKPSKEIQALTKGHGGINKGQTLFKKDSEDGLIIAMLWPWNDGTHTTLKMFISQEESCNQKVGKKFFLIDWMKKLFPIFPGNRTSNLP